MAFDEAAAASILAELSQEHGERATYARASGGAAKSVLVFFNEDGDQYDDGTIAGVVRARPRVKVQSADVPLIAEGDAFTVRGIAYLVHTVMPSNMGLREIRLRLAA